MNHSSTVIIIRASKTKLRIIHRILKLAYGSVRIDRLRTFGVFRFRSWHQGAAKAAEMLKRSFFGLTLTVCTIANASGLTPRQCRHAIEISPYSASQAEGADSSLAATDGGLMSVRSFAARVLGETGGTTPDCRTISPNAMRIASLPVSQFLLARELLVYGLFRSDQFLHHRLSLPGQLARSVMQASKTLSLLAEGRQIVGLGFDCKGGPGGSASLAVAVRPRNNLDHEQFKGKSATVSLIGVGIFTAALVFAGNTMYQQLQGQKPANPQLAVYPASGGSFGTIGGTFSCGNDTFGFSCGHVLWKTGGFDTHAQLHPAIASAAPVTTASNIAVPVIVHRCEMPAHFPADPRDLAVFGPVPQHKNIRHLAPPFSHAIQFLQAEIAMVGAGSGRQVSKLEKVLADFEVDPGLYGGPVIFRDLLVAAPFTSPGDSGALWFEIESNEPLGVHTLKQDIDGQFCSVAQALSCLLPQFQT